jgi:oxygen-independent coproporphyrinogen-3 oxidase
MEGLSLQEVEKEFGQEITHLILKAAKPHLQHDHLKKLNNFLLITNEGKLFADRIASDLFLL